MLLNFAHVSACEWVAKVKYFQCKRWLQSVLRHKYPYIGLQTRCIMVYVQKVYSIQFYMSGVLHSGVS